MVAHGCPLFVPFDAGHRTGARGCRAVAPVVDTTDHRGTAARYRRKVRNRFTPGQRAVLVIGWGLSLAVLASTSATILGTPADGQWINGNSRLVEITASYQVLAGEVPLEIGIRWVVAIVAWVIGSMVILHRPLPPTTT